MEWYPLELSVHVRNYAFGERLIPEMLGKKDVPEGVVAETWEVSDHRDARATILNGPLGGSAFHDLVMEHPEEVVGTGWKGPHFPMLGKFLDASHPLPVHLHANDEAAQRIYGEPHGKSEAWHILWAEPGATILAGVDPDRTDSELFEAFKRQDYDAVMYRHPIQAGDTVYVPGGILHAFGPNTLIFEIQQTSDLGQTVMPEDLYGNRKSEEQWDEDIRKTLVELERDYFPRPNPGLLRHDGPNRLNVGCAGPYFALERWNLREAQRLDTEGRRSFTISNVGEPITIHFESGEDTVARATSRVIPAALGSFEVVPEEDAGDVIVCYIPDLHRDIVEPLRAAGHRDEDIARLGVVPL
jgi:mannose-6-phosphate isomerase